MYAAAEVELDAVERAPAARLWSGTSGNGEYDGEHDWTDPKQYARDIERLEFPADQGWVIIRVSAGQLRYDDGGVVERVKRALRKGGCPA